MGRLVEGIWQPGWYEPGEGGAFVRPDAQFRGWVAPEDVEPGRYHLYAAYACPWAHRTLITRALRRLEGVIGVTIVDPKMGDDGWAFGGDRGDDDPILHAGFLRDVYLRASPRYTGHVTVPVLWDKKAGTIVNNESRDLMRMLDVAFAKYAEGPTLVPAEKEHAIDEMITANYGPYNNGVYRAGFASSQEAYDIAVRDIFGALDRCESILARQRYLCGDVLTEADVAFFTTSLRFDLVYYSHFKCNVRRLQDYPNVWGFVRDLYQRPEIMKTCNLEHIKRHYYWSQNNVNPRRIVPVGPFIDYDAPHDRARFARPRAA